MIGRIKCFFGYHDFGNWSLYGYSIHPVKVTMHKRFCERCGKEETLIKKRD